METLENQSNPGTLPYWCTQTTPILCRLYYAVVTTAGKDSSPHGRRFVYGYSLDGSDFPCYLLWPVRTPTGSYCLLESQTQQYVDMEHVDYLHPLGLRHFHDGFSLRAEVSIRIPALEAFQLQEFFFAQPNERLSIVGHLDPSQ